MPSDYELADGPAPVPEGIRPNLHFQHLRLRFVDGRPMLESTISGEYAPFPLAIPSNYLIRGEKDGRQYFVPLEGQEIMLTITVLHWDLNQVTPPGNVIP